MDGWLSPCNSIDFEMRMRKNFVFALLFSLSVFLSLLQSLLVFILFLGI